MQPIKNIAELEALYGQPKDTTQQKVKRHLTPQYQSWIAAARFCIISTVGPEGTDASPRGDDGPVVRIVSETEIWLPDWRGNNRVDCLRNLVRDDRASLMFLVHGSLIAVRANGRAIVTADREACESFEQNGKHPRSVIVFTVEEVYFQCSKAIMRSRLWDASTAEAVPTQGTFVKEIREDLDVKSYDAGYAEEAKDRMW